MYSSLLTSHKHKPNKIIKKASTSLHIKIISKTALTKRKLVEMNKKGTQNESIKIISSKNKKNKNRDQTNIIFLKNKIATN